MDWDEWDGSGWITCLGLKLGLRSGLGVGLGVGVGLELVWDFGIWIEIGIEKGMGICIGLGLGISISQVRGSGCFDKPSPRIRRCWTSHFGGSVILNKPDSFGESMFADPEFLIKPSSRNSLFYQPGSRIMIICYIRFLDPNVRYSWIAYPDILTNKVRGFVFLF